MKRCLWLIVLVLVAPATAVAEYSAPPSSACAFMDSVGMQTRGYKQFLGETFMCSSPYKTLGSGFRQNNLAYYARGSRTTVKRFYLVLNVNVKSLGRQARRVLAKAAGVLVKQALKARLPRQVRRAILAGRSGRWKIGRARITLKRENWPTGRGHSLKFTID